MKNICMTSTRYDKLKNGVSYMKGKVSFDYSNNDGIVSIGRGNAHFDTRWSRAGGKSIHAYKDTPSIDAIALATNAQEITDIKDASRYDYSSRVRNPEEEQILLLRNVNGIYAALKIRDIKAVGYDGDTIDEVTFDYVILEDGSRDFTGVTNIQVTDISFSGKALLLGAGFSRNWGGLLAAEVSEQILTHPAIQARPRLYKMLESEPSFENALEKVRTGLYEAADAEAMDTAIKAIFDSMDEAYKRAASRDPNTPINDFIARFCPGAVGIGTGYVFSLNQDLLLERIYGTIPDKQKLSIPGITWSDGPLSFPVGARPIPFALPQDPTKDEPQLIGKFNYIKLHGSINWRTAKDPAALIMGRRKSLMISESPLVGWYHRVFEQVLQAGTIRLMVIGYGWGDEHVNEIIANAIRNHGLKIFSWDRSHPKDLLQGKHRGDEILGGIIGFITLPLIEIMSRTHSDPGSDDYRAIVKDFFEQTGDRLGYDS